MKILFLSDIHGNYPALLSLEKYFSEVDKIICLGDVVGYHCFVNEVIDFLILHKVFCIQGNHDRYLIEGLENQSKFINDSVRFGIEIAQKKITEKNKKWLGELPTSYSFKQDDNSIFCCHGSPWDVTNEYIYADSDKFHIMTDFAYDIIVLGHTHRAYTKYNENQIVFNPGSVGQARDFEGMACAKIYNTRTNELTDIREPYDFWITLKDSISHGAQDWIYKHFKTVM